MNKMIEKVVRKAKVSAGITGLKIRRNSAELSLGFGIGGIILTVFESSKATLSAGDILELHRQRMEEAKEAIKAAEECHVAYNPGREKLIIWSRTFVDLAKLYAPAITLGGLSVGAIILSRNITHRRYLAAVAAYNAVREAFESYRERVREEMGDMYDHHFRYGTELREVTEEMLDEKGKKKKVTKLEEVEGTEQLDKDRLSFWWDEYLPDGRKNSNWDANPEFCLSWLRGRENLITDLGRKQGYLFVNDVLRELGLPGVFPEGQLLGWVFSKDNYAFIDLGIHDPVSSKSEGGRGRRFLITLKPDGVVYDKLHALESPFLRESMA